MELENMLPAPPRSGAAPRYAATDAAGEVPLVAPRGITCRRDNPGV